MKTYDQKFKIFIVDFFRFQIDEIFNAKSTKLHKKIEFVKSPMIKWLKEGGGVYWTEYLERFKLKWKIMCYWNITFKISFKIKSSVIELIILKYTIKSTIIKNNIRIWFISFRWDLRRFLS